MHYLASILGRCFQPNAPAAFSKNALAASQRLHHASASVTRSAQAPAATQCTHIDGGEHSPPRTQALRHDSPSTSNTFYAHAPSACYTQAEHAARRPGWLPLEAKADPPSQKLRRGTGFPSGSCEPSTAREPGQGPRGLLCTALSPSEDYHRHVEVPEHQSRRTAT